MKLYKSLSLVLKSAVLMTWANLLSRTLGLALLLPAILTMFPEADILLWYVLTTMVGLGLLFDLGFTPTFVRFVAYAKSGSSVSEMVNIGKKVDAKSKEGLNADEGLPTVFKIIDKNYTKLSITAFVFLLVIGSFFVQKPIADSSDVFYGWASWFVVILSTSFLLLGNKYVAVLQGAGLIAENQKVMLITSLFSTITAACALFLGGSLFLVICLYQGGNAFSYVLNRNLLKKHLPMYFDLPGNISNDDNENLVAGKLKKTISSSAWKSAVGIFMSVGLIHLSALAAANYLSTGEAASYLLALQFIRSISAFSQVPFYTKIPVLAKLYAQDKKTDIYDIAFKSEVQSLAFFSFCCLVAGLLFPILETHFSFNAAMPEGDLWVLLSIGILIERAGAIHIQIYSLTNHIIWHYVNGVTGVFMVAIFLILIENLGVLAFPVSLLVSYILLYFPISTFYATKVMGGKYIVMQLLCLLSFLLILLFPYFIA